VSLDLVIFDCDGVLVDSEPTSNRVLARLLTEVGLPTTYEEAVATYKGHSWPACLELIEPRLGRALPHGFVDRFRAERDAEFEKTLRAVPGIESALRAISTPKCVASSGAHAKMRATLGATELLHHFEGRIFSASDVERPKPAPDLFLFAAQKLGARAAHCVVVEDSVVGIEGAFTAGMQVLGFAGTETADAAALASAGASVFSDMRALPSLLEELA
jgi:phosphoglycolate phosphatase